MEMAVRKAILATCAQRSRFMGQAAIGVYMGWRQEYDASRHGDTWKKEDAIVGLRRAACKLSDDARQIKPCSVYTAERWWRLLESAGVIHTERVGTRGSRITGMRFVVPELLGAGSVRRAEAEKFEEPKTLARREAQRRHQQASRERKKKRTAAQCAIVSENDRPGVS